MINKLEWYAAEGSLPSVKTQTRNRCEKGGDQTLKSCWFPIQAFESLLEHAVPFSHQCSLPENIQQVSIKDYQNKK